MIQTYYYAKNKDEFFITIIEPHGEVNIKTKFHKKIKGELHYMDNTEKKLNQILNLLNLTHNENTFMLEFIKNLFINEADRKAIEKYIEKCNVQKEAIISGLYEDDMKITH